MKINYYLRIFETFSFLVSMLQNVLRVPPRGAGRATLGFMIPEAKPRSMQCNDNRLGRRGMGL